MIINNSMCLYPLNAIKERPIDLPHELSVFTGVLDGETFTCLVDSTGKPLIRMADIDFHSLSELVKEYPQFTYEQNLDKLAAVSNFLFSGLEYRLIDPINEFKSNYLGRLEQGKEASAFETSAIFNVDELRPPKTTDEQFIFFVQDQWGIPYRVTCDYPFTGETYNASYSLLPYMDF